MPPPAHVDELVERFQKRAQTASRFSQRHPTAAQDLKHMAEGQAYAFSECADALLAALRSPGAVPREPEFVHAAVSLANSVPDVVLEALREEWGHSNVAVVQHWRDTVLAAAVPPQALIAPTEEEKSVSRIPGSNSESRPQHA